MPRTTASPARINASSSASSTRTVMATGGRPEAEAAVLAVAVLEHAAAHRDPLCDADETSAVGIGLADARSGVGDLDDHGPVHTLDRHSRRTGGGVLQVLVRASWTIR